MENLSLEFEFEKNLNFFTGFQNVFFSGSLPSLWFFLNKYLLDGMKLEAPLFIIWFQCLIAFFLCGLMSGVAKFFPKFAKFLDFKIDKKLSREVNEKFCEEIFDFLSRSFRFRSFALRWLRLRIYVWNTSESRFITLNDRWPLFSMW